MVHDIIWGGCAGPNIPFMRPKLGGHGQDCRQVTRDVLRSWEGLGLWAIYAEYADGSTWYISPSYVPGWVTREELMRRLRELSDRESRLLYARDCKTWPGNTIPDPLTIPVFNIETADYFLTPEQVGEEPTDWVVKALWVLVAIFVITFAFAAGFGVGADWAGVP